MNISKAGLDLILEFENKLERAGPGKYKAYRCPAGVPTIYAGCTEGVFMGMVVTEEQGEQMFAREIAKFERAVVRLCTREPNQNQFDALVSLAYNIGEGGLAKSSVLRHFNAGRFDKAAKSFALWNKAQKNGRGPLVEMRGLTRRRAAEAVLFMRPIEAEMPEQTEEPDMPQQVAPEGMSTGGKVLTASTLGGGSIGLGFMADPAGSIQTAVAVKSGAGQLLSGIDLTSFGVPLIIIIAALAAAWFMGRK